MVLEYFKGIFGEHVSGLDNVQEHKHYAKAIMLYNAAKKELLRGNYLSFTTIFESYSKQMNLVNDEKLRQELSTKLLDLGSYRVINNKSKFNQIKPTQSSLDAKL